MTVNYHEPGKMEVWLTMLAGKLFGRSVYEPYVNSLGLRGDEKVLDFGSGAGTPAQLIAGKLAEGSGTLTCVDVSQVWIKTAQKRLQAYSNVTFLSGEISDLDVPDESHDIVFIHFVIHDIPARQRPLVVK
ncbi:MAG: methyltransferase domain-containing protein, partial [Anaerolineae bacterium]|nr:methyltransferase domain-containing protein [Anaerolineae bacterium]